MKEPTNKWQHDFQKASDMRKSLAKSLNYYLSKNGTGLHVVKMNSRSKIMNIAEKVKNNLVSNRVKRSTYSKSMGLHYVLKYKDGRQGERYIVFIDRESNGSMYLKLPKEFLTDPDGYIQLLKMLDYYVIVVENNKISHPISMAFVEKWPHKKSESKGNKNRLQFYVDVEQIECRHPEASGGLLNEYALSAVEAMEELMIMP